MSTKNKYTMPVPQSQLQRIDRTSPAHIGNLRNAVDFIVLPNTTALAVVDGMVPYVKDDPMLVVPIHRIGTILTLSQSCTKTEVCPV